MARLYLLQSWTNAAEDDYHLSAGYSGEQIGRRGSTSRQVHTVQRGRQWYANLEAYREDKEEGQDSAKTLEYRVYPQQKTLDNIEDLIVKTERQFKDGVIDSEQYYSFMGSLEQKREKAWQSLCKAKGWEDIQENIHQPRIIEWEDALYTALALVFYGLGIIYIIYIMTL